MPGAIIKCLTISFMLSKESGVQTYLPRTLVLSNTSELPWYPTFDYHQCYLRRSQQHPDGAPQLARILKISVTRFLYPLPVVTINVRQSTAIVNLHNRVSSTLIAPLCNRIINKITNKKKKIYLIERRRWSFALSRYKLLWRSFIAR